MSLLVASLRSLKMDPIVGACHIIVRKIYLGAYPGMGACPGDYGSRKFSRVLIFALFVDRHVFTKIKPAKFNLPNKITCVHAYTIVMLSLLSHVPCADITLINAHVYVHCTFVEFTTVFCAQDLDTKTVFFPIKSIKTCD